MSARLSQRHFPDSGFTLIELLVVITIIGILAAIGLVFFSSTTQAARDAKRKADIHAIRNALEMYRSDKGTYPTTDQQSCNPTGTTGFAGNCPTSNQGDVNQWTNAVGGANYYNGGTAPMDPSNLNNGTYNYTYIYDASGNATGVKYNVCVWRYEVNSVKSGDFCMGPQQ